MVLAAFNGQTLDTEGNVVLNFQVEVRSELGSAPLATLFSDRDGLTPLGNPFTPSPLSNGYFRFHVAGGVYRIRAFTTNGNVSDWRFVGIGLGGESDVIAFPGFLMTFSANNTAGANTGEIRADNANLALATELYVSTVDNGGSSIQDRLTELNSGDTIILSQSGSQASYTVNTATIASPPDFVTVDISNHDGATILQDGAIIGFQTFLQGPAGNVTTSGSVSDNQFARFKGTTGSLIEGADLGDSPPTPVSLASASNVRSSAPGKLIHAGLIESASATVALTGSPLALSWDDGINFSLELAANTTLPNPTNGQPGTWRTVYVSGTVTSPPSILTLSFDTQYEGPAVVDTVPDIQGAVKDYLLSIFCSNTTFFIITAIPVELT